MSLTVEGRADTRRSVQRVLRYVYEHSVVQHRAPWSASDLSRLEVLHVLDQYVDGTLDAQDFDRLVAGAQQRGEILSFSAMDFRTTAAFLRKPAEARSAGHRRVDIPLGLGNAVVPFIRYTYFITLRCAGGMDGVAVMGNDYLADHQERDMVGSGLFSAQWLQQMAVASDYAHADPETAGTGKLVIDRGHGEPYELRFAIDASGALQSDSATLPLLDYILWSGLGVHIHEQGGQLKIRRCEQQ